MPRSPLAPPPAYTVAPLPTRTTLPSTSGRNPNDSAAANALPYVSDMTLDRLLVAKRDLQCSPKQVWETLMNLGTTAGRELRDSCLVANAAHPEQMAFSMATLFCTSAQERTIEKLDDVGIFFDRTRRDHLTPDDASLLLSDEGLQLWLRFAASPSAYISVFVDSILNETFAAEPSGSLAAALRVLVASGRDTTNDVAASDVPGNVYLPLAHLCSQVAPEWLPSLLTFGTDANQRTAGGVPLVATALAAQAHRMYLEGHDLLFPHASLYRLGAMLQAHGANLSQRSRTGSPPVMLLALNGYCAAAETLLALGAGNETADQNGNTLMHYLAALTHLRQHAVSAFFQLNLALRFGGDPDAPNHEGTTATSLLAESLSQYLRLSKSMIAHAREAAQRILPTVPTVQTAHTAHTARTATAPAPPCAPSADVPPFVAAMAGEARRLCEQGHDPLLPHVALFELGMSFERDGIDIGQRHPDGTPPVMWLTRHGYCGAAEVLLALNANANAPDQDGNTLMHALADATRAPENAILFVYMLTAALRYGGDPTQTNRSGQTPLSFLCADRIRFVRASFAFVTETRKSAQRKAANYRQSTAHSPIAFMRHSAASL